jgi:hypothetical protein
MYLITGPTSWGMDETKVKLDNLVRKGSSMAKAK